MTDSDSSNDVYSVEEGILYFEDDSSGTESADDDEAGNGGRGPRCRALPVRTAEGPSSGRRRGTSRWGRRRRGSRSALEHRLVKKICCSFVRFRYTLAIYKYMYKLLVHVCYNLQHAQLVTSAIVCERERSMIRVRLRVRSRHGRQARAALWLRCCRILLGHGAMNSKSEWGYHGAWRS